jgi:hypothetical protein
MALVGRSARRGGAGSRWLIIGVVLTLVILLVDASLHSRSSGPGQQLAAGAWVDQALPIIATSNAEGQELAGLWTHGLHSSGASVSSELTQLTNGANAAYRQAIALRPPTTVAGAAGLLEACLLARAEAASALRTTLGPTLTGSTRPTSGLSGTNPTVASIQSVGADLKVGDQAYQLFLKSLPKLGIKMPSSMWVADATPYQAGPAQIFLTSLANEMTSTPVHQVQIYSVTTSPPAVASRGSIQVLPTSPVMWVTVVVADVGNQAENGLTVTASINSGGGNSAGGAGSVRDFADLQPGQAHSIVGMGPLNPPQGVPVTLTVTVTPEAGSPTQAATESLTFEMPSPNAPPTTSGPSTTSGSAASSG